VKSIVIEAAHRVAVGLAPRVRDKEKAPILGLTIGALSSHPPSASEEMRQA
jgi:hypothetical protein